MWGGVGWGASGADSGAGEAEGECAAGQGGATGKTAKLERSPRPASLSVVVTSSGKPFRPLCLVEAPNISSWHRGLVL